MQTENSLLQVEQPVVGIKPARASVQTSKPSFSHSGSAASAAVKVSGLQLSYDKTAILRGIDFELPRGQTLALLGPSGCGKTTLLRLLAGLLGPTKGEIELDGKSVANAASGLFAPPEKRGLGMVFQDYALWPHMSVAGNVSFPLEMRGIGKAERERRVAVALDKVGLGHLGLRRPSDLSGGQQQRVAIARAIVAEPAIVLFDEPLSNLDRELRETMVGEIADLVHTLGLTAVYVTHDQAEAFSLADQIAVMRNGLIEQLAAPEHLVDRPATAGVAEFLKLGCVASTHIQDDAYWLAGTDTRLAHIGDVAFADANRVLLPSRDVRLGNPAQTAISGHVRQSQFRGQDYLVTVRIGSDIAGCDLQLTSPVRVHPGETVGLDVGASALRWFAA